MIVFLQNYPIGMLAHLAFVRASQNRLPKLGHSLLSDAQHNIAHLLQYQAVRHAYQDGGMNDESVIIIGKFEDSEVLGPK